MLDLTSLALQKSRVFLSFVFFFFPPLRTFLGWLESKSTGKAQFLGCPYFKTQKVPILNSQLVWMGRQIRKIFFLGSLQASAQGLDSMASSTVCVSQPESNCKNEACPFSPFQVACIFGSCACSPGPHRAFVQLPKDGSCKHFVGVLGELGGRRAAFFPSF